MDGDRTMEVTPPTRFTDKLYDDDVDIRKILYENLKSITRLRYIILTNVLQKKVRFFPTSVEFKIISFKTGNPSYSHLLIRRGNPR